MKNSVDKFKSLFNKKNIIIFSILVIVLISSYFLYMEYKPKFKNITIEAGTKSVSIRDFLTNAFYINNAKILTDLSKIDLDKTSEIDIKLSYKGNEEIVKLTIVDTIAPNVELQNITRYSGYEINPNDFILNLDELEDTTIEYKVYNYESEYKDYEVDIIVTDESNNKTTKKCILTISWIKPLINIEVGDTFSLDMILENVKKYENTINKDEINKINTSYKNEYILTANYNNQIYTSKIIVVDTKAPELELKNLTIYNNKKVDKDDFINSVKDNSNKVTTTMKTKIDYTIIGEQTITIEAIDESGNKTEKSTKLVIKKDTDGPVFSGIKDINVVKNSSIDYFKGVSAYDSNYGSCKFTVDYSKVNTSNAGTYYATYSSKDSLGNSTVVKRKIIIAHDNDDTNIKFNNYYNNYLANKSVLQMASLIRSNIRYSSNWGGSDPVWYGLTYNSGNCYVHALILQKALNKAGITNKLIYVKDKTHYWNLVYLDGVWRHYDSTPGTHIIGPATDTAKYNSSAMRGRDWDRSLFPVAN